ncbi:hypothetical protein [Acetobacter aceti]|uniref:hypothetical protein n=1 Tax=Acetobacter aceti TaxID=435 RepID=UPI000C076BE8|nr:hypothetical protein [Acetobacter aceti]
MVWIKAASVIPSGHEGISVTHPTLRSDDGTLIMLRRSIPGVFNILRYTRDQFSLDLTITKKVQSVGAMKGVVVTLFLHSDLKNYRRISQHDPRRYEIGQNDMVKIITDIRLALSGWPGFFHPDDGVMIELARSDAQLTWYEAEEMAEDPSKQYYWIGSTELGIQVEKQIIEHVVAGCAFRIAEEDKLWAVASARYADEAAGDVVIL